jgi:hypothetical protein
MLVKKQSKLSELRWPIGIILAICGVVALGVWTIEQANIKPVVMDDYYFESYQDVEANINDIRAKQAAFDKKYNVQLLTDVPFIIGKNSLAIKLTTKANNLPVADANITVKITRPDTDKYDKRPKVTEYEKGVYHLKPFDIEKIGRWQIMTKITTPDALVSFSKTEVNATK